jgi:AAA15 family ATPase/GTPase
MRHIFFEVKNYRGIGTVKLDLAGPPSPPVFTLVGLNESGKTTILEAINSFSHRDDLNPLDVPGYTTRDVHELIPISQRSNFNGTISITAGFSCDPEDELAIARFAHKELGVVLASLIGDF